jgi:hypothetical protein
VFNKTPGKKVLRGAVKAGTFFSASGVYAWGGVQLKTIARLIGLSQCFSL